MPITRSQQKEIDRKEREMREKSALKSAIATSLSKWPTTLGNLEHNMNNLNTNDDISLNAPTMNKKYHHGRPLGREHTDPMDQPLNLADLDSADTSNIPVFSAAKIKQYKAQRIESMFDTFSPTDNSLKSTTYTSNSSGNSTTGFSLSRDRLSNLSANSVLEELKFRSSSDEAIHLAERRQSISEVESTATIETFSISDT